MLRLAPNLPDALVGVTRVMDGVLDETRETFPGRLDDLVGAPVNVGVHGVNQHPPAALVAADSHGRFSTDGLPDSSLRVAVTAGDPANQRTVTEWFRA